MSSPSLSPDLAEAERLAREVTGSCIGCGDKECEGCWDPFAPKVDPKPAERARRVWQYPISERERVRLRDEVARRSEALGVKVADLAAHAGVTHQAVSRWLRRQLTAVGDDRITKIVEYLDAIEVEAGVEVPSPEALHQRVRQVLERYQIQQKALAAKAGVKAGEFDPEALAAGDGSDEDARTRGATGSLAAS
ncbi:hypothetical protein ETD86_37010 [Nonomuraea turkmeniaca]|uniref:Uncharacterized protein n=1 Tax=Nonomuraea turkmeniaca TaxID=103838 RepID=A0A5S4F4S0_9ACTN|nr:hypothetical protein [Nonomuraea turkmeniaca]TMR11048.1 hypothetical protein ETD86_37010 [Nonomuraea turkmeniaca]